MNAGKLNEKLRSLRENCGFTQDQVSKILNLDRSTYTYYETGKTQPSVDTLVKLSNLYKVDVSYLLRRESASSTLKTNDSDPSKKAAGRKSAGKPASSAAHIYDLDKEEHQLLAYFRMLDPEKKESLLTQLARETKEN